MELKSDYATSTYQIERIETDHIVVSGKICAENIIIMPELIQIWDVDSFASLQVENFQTICDLNPEVVLLGTGQQIRFPNADLLVPLINAGIGIEVMDIPAACRTYSILTSEERNVAVALLFD